jgi:2-polyprenyl-3-methyl-5-hydroxy-6-metoxy-1,4-benzoquinol methylase
MSDMANVIDNRQIYDANWQSWLDMKVHGPASRWLRSLIRSQINAIPHPERIRSILDVGCGEGTITYSLAKWLPGAKTVGVDFSETGIRCAESRYTCKIFNSSMTNPPGSSPGSTIS